MLECVGSPAPIVRSLYFLLREPTVDYFWENGFYQILVKIPSPPLPTLLATRIL